MATPTPQWEDTRLVAACLEGDDRAWEALVRKYQRLVYGVIVRYRVPEGEAEDIFQAVWVELFQHLGELREAEAVRGWLARVAANRCYRWKERQRGHESLDESPMEGEAALRTEPEWAGEMERQQLVRESLGRLSERCRRLVAMLFYEDPPRAYGEVARELGLAEGSIGFIRGRCLQKLTAALEELGL
jgi:RNA polymerase sigma factor (sigma-70 family)